MRITSGGWILGLAASALTLIGAAPEPKDSEGKPKLLNPGEIIRPDDYPEQSLEKGEQGTAVIRLTVDPSGKVSACTIETSSKSPLLDETSCRVYRERARYEAVAGAGPRQFTHAVRWRMTELGPSRLGWFNRMSVLIASSGDQTNCKVESSVGPDTECRMTTKYPAESAARIVKDVGTDLVRLVIEERFVPEGESMAEPASRFMISRRSAKVVVKADGTLRSCEVLDSLPATMKREVACREASQRRFEALAETPDVTGIFRTWIYYEPVAVKNAERSDADAKASPE